MQTVDVQDYARRLFDAHGAKAVAEAAQKARALWKIRASARTPSPGGASNRH